METIITESLARAMSYRQYRESVQQSTSEKNAPALYAQGLLHYTQLNEVRMNRLDKTLEVPAEVENVFQNLSKNYTWLVLTEGWCGDAAQLVPVFDKISQVSDKISLKIVLRDGEPELMDLFLTAGSRSIPKLIVIAGEKVVGDWGPRPAGATQLIMRHKAEKGVIDEEAKTALQLWYLKDKGLSSMRELADLMLAIDAV